MQNFGGNRSCDTDFRAKKLKCQSENFNRSRLKTNCGRRIKFSNLEMLGDVVSAPTFKFFKFRHFFFVIGTSVTLRLGQWFSNCVPREISRCAVQVFAILENMLVPVFQLGSCLNYCFCKRCNVVSIYYFSSCFKIFVKIEL